MKSQKSKIVISIFKYSFFTIIFLGALLYIFRKDIIVYISHISHPEELNFVKKFLVDFQNADLNQLKKYFLNDKYKRVLNMLKKHDSKLYSRKYHIKDFSQVFYDQYEKENIKRFFRACIKLYTKENENLKNWIDICIIKKDEKFFIENFQLGWDFPRPPNRLSTKGQKN